MKKLIAIFAVLLLAAPAFAADWEFYGSQRMATFYVARDAGDFSTLGTGDVGTGENDDWGLQWTFQDNARLGAKVKADKVRGQVELALNASSGNGGDQPRGSNGGDGSVTARRAYGEWKFADNASLKVGKDYSPVTNLVSGQVFDFDAGLLGQGDFYGRRPGQIGLQVGGLELALITNAASAASASGTITAGGTTVNLAQYNINPNGADPDNNYPKIEARYTLKTDMFELIPFGGFQYFTISATDTTKAANTLTDDIDIISYVGGLVAKVNLGAFYFVAEGAYGQNWGNANWQNGRGSGLDTRLYSGVSGITVTGAKSIGGFYSSASLKGTDDTNDATSWMALALVGLKFTDTVKFEVGAGYRNDDPDINGVDNSEAWEAYGQVVLTLAPGVYLIPEVGYIDYMDDPLTDQDLGYQWYAGAKWQIDF